jgi:hypothetical protein
VEGVKLVVLKKNLTIHHPKPLNRRKRNLKDWKNLEELELRCDDHHEDLPKHFRRGDKEC